MIANKAIQCRVSVMFHLDGYLTKIISGNRPNPMRFNSDKRFADYGDSVMDCQSEGKAVFMDENVPIATTASEISIPPHQRARRTA